MLEFLAVSTHRASPRNPFARSLRAGNRRIHIGAEAKIETRFRVLCSRDPSLLRRRDRRNRKGRQYHRRQNPHGETPLLAAQSSVLRCDLPLRQSAPGRSAAIDCIVDQRKRSTACRCAPRTRTVRSMAGSLSPSTWTIVLAPDVTRRTSPLAAVKFATRWNA
jgi:hypothetical protein